MFEGSINHLMMDVPLPPGETDSTWICGADFSAKEFIDKRLLLFSPVVSASDSSLREYNSIPPSFCRVSLFIALDKYSGAMYPSVCFYTCIIQNILCNGRIGHLKKEQTVSSAPINPVGWITLISESRF